MAAILQHSKFVSTLSRIDGFICRNNADAELQDNVAQHAADCKQQLSSSTAQVDTTLDKVSDDHVMQLEEAGVHKVSYIS